MFRSAVSSDHKAIYVAACFNLQKSNTKIDFPKGTPAKFVTCL